MTTPAHSPGLEGVIAGETAICTVEGGLSYRGYGVGDLAEHCSFDEVAHLLLHGELPTAAQLDRLSDSRVAAARRLPPPLKDLLAALPKWTTPARRPSHCRLSARPLRPGCGRQLARCQPPQGRTVAGADPGRYRRPLPPRQGTAACLRARQDLGQAANFLYMLRGSRADAGGSEGPRCVAHPLRRARVQRQHLRGPGDRLDPLRHALGHHRAPSGH